MKKIPMCARCGTCRCRQCMTANPKGCRVCHATHIVMAEPPEPLLLEHDATLLERVQALESASRSGADSFKMLFDEHTKTERRVVDMDNCHTELTNAHLDSKKTIEALTVDVVRLMQRISKLEHRVDLLIKHNEVVYLDDKFTNPEEYH